MKKCNRIRAHKVLVVVLAALQGERWATRFLSELLAVCTSTGLEALDAMEAPREFTATLYGHEVAVYLSEPFDNVLVEVRDNHNNRIYVVVDEVGVISGRMGRFQAWELADALADVARWLREYPGAWPLWEVVSRLREV